MIVKHHASDGGHPGSHGQGRKVNVMSFMSFEKSLILGIYTLKKNTLTCTYQPGTGNVYVCGQTYTQTGGQTKTIGP